MQAFNFFHTFKVISLSRWTTGSTFQYIMLYQRFIRTINLNLLLKALNTSLTRLYLRKKKKKRKGWYSNSAACVFVTRETNSKEKETLSVLVIRTFQWRSRACVKTMETLSCFRDPLLSWLTDRHLFLPLVHLVISEKKRHFYILNWTAGCLFIPHVEFNSCFCVTWSVPNT